MHNVIPSEARDLSECRTRIPRFARDDKKFFGFIEFGDQMTEWPPQRQTRPPTHPGELMREIIEEHARLSVTDAARRMGVSRQALHAVLCGCSAMSADMALRFARLVGGRAELFLRMQENLDLWSARRRLAGRLARIEPVAPKRAA